MAQEKLTKRAEEKLTPLKLDVDKVTRTKAILNQNQIQKIFNSTPQRYQYARPGKGGGSWNYVRKGYVRRVLDSIFGFDHDFEVETSVGEAFEVAQQTGSCVVKGTLICRVRDEHGEHTLRKSDFGRAEVKFKQGSKDPLDFGNDMKAAATDCFKRCAAQLGIAADVYDPVEFQAIELTGSDEANDKTKAAEKRAAKAKAELAKKAKEKA